MAQRRPFSFPGAGQGAPAPVRALVAAVRRLPERKRGAMALWARLLGPAGTPPYKLDPRDVEYVARSGPRGQRCKNCQRFYVHAPTGTGICDAVRGKIYAEDWCNRWIAPLDASEYVVYQGGDARVLVKGTERLVVGRPLPRRFSRFRPLAYGLVGVLLGITANAWGQEPSTEVLQALAEPGSVSVYLWAKVVAEGGLPVVLALLLALIARGVPLRLSLSEVDRELLRGLSRGGRRGDS